MWRRNSRIRNNRSKQPICNISWLAKFKTELLNWKKPSYYCCSEEFYSWETFSNDFRDDMPRDGGERREGGERRDCYGYPFLFLDTHGFHCRAKLDKRFRILQSPQKSRKKISQRGAASESRTWNLHWLWAQKNMSSRKSFGLTRNKTPRSNSNRLAFFISAILFWIWQE